MELKDRAEEQNNNAISKERTVVDKCTAYAHEQVDTLRGMEWNSKTEQRGKAKKDNGASYAHEQVDTLRGMEWNSKSEQRGKSKEGQWHVLCA